MVPDVNRLPPGQYAALVDVLMEESAAFVNGQEFNSFLSMDQHGLTIRRPREHVRDEGRHPVIASMAVLVLDATPSEAHLDMLLRHHHRLSDVAGNVRIPESVRIIQDASAGNGHAAMKDSTMRASVLARVAADRERYPVATPEGEGVVVYKAMREDVEALGFSPDRVITWARHRGTNALQDVTRLQLVGRPHPPGDAELFRTAAALHHDEEVLDFSVRRRWTAYGGQRSRCRYSTTGTCACLPS
jgi:hypothetical protein